MKAIIVGTSHTYKQEELRGYQMIPTPYGVMSYFQLKPDTILVLRHGFRGYHLYPEEINYRANMWGISKLGCDIVILLSSVGILSDHIQKNIPVIVTDLYYPYNQLPSGEVCTYGGQHLLAGEKHPLFCPELIAETEKILRTEMPVVKKGTYAYLQGPRTKTPLENRVFEQIADINSMTLGPEIVLANELGLRVVAIGVGHVDKRGFGRSGTSETSEASHAIQDVDGSLVQSANVTMSIIWQLSQTRFSSVSHITTTTPKRSVRLGRQDSALKRYKHQFSMFHSIGCIVFSIYFISKFGTVWTHTESAYRYLPLILFSLVYMLLDTVFAIFIKEWFIVPHHVVCVIMYVSSLLFDSLGGYFPIVLGVLEVSALTIHVSCLDPKNEFKQIVLFLTYVVTRVYLLVVSVFWIIELTKIESNTRIIVTVCVILLNLFGFYILYTSEDAIRRAFLFIRESVQVDSLKCNAV